MWQSRARYHERVSTGLRVKCRVQKRKNTVMQLPSQMKTCSAVFCIRLLKIFCAKINIHILPLLTQVELCYSALSLFFFYLKYHGHIAYWPQRDLPHPLMAAIFLLHGSTTIYWTIFDRRTYGLFLMFCYFKKWHDDLSVYIYIFMYLANTSVG